MAATVTEAVAENVTSAFPDPSVFRYASCSTGIHASEGVRPVKPGDVHVDDTAVQDAAETAHAEQDTFEATAPAGNASRTDWEAYALTQGRSNEELAGLSRDQIRDLFATE